MQAMQTGQRDKARSMVAFVVPVVVFYMLLLVASTWVEGLWLGWLGIEAMPASLVLYTNHSLYFPWLPFVFCFGIGFALARRLRQGNVDAAQSVARTSILLAGAVGLVAAALMYVFTDYSWVGPSASFTDVEIHMAGYGMFSCLSFAAQCVAAAAAAVWFAAGKVKQPVIAAVVCFVAKFALVPLSALAPGWDAVINALFSFLSHGVLASVLLLGLLHSSGPLGRFTLFAPWRWGDCKVLLAQGWPVALEGLFVALESTILFWFYAIRLGANLLYISSFAGNLESNIWYAGCSASLAVLLHTSMKMGTEGNVGFRQLWKSMSAVAVCMLAFMLPSVYYHGFGDEYALGALAVGVSSYIGFLVQIATGALAFCCAGVLRAGGRSIMPSLVVCGSTALYSFLYWASPYPPYIWWFMVAVGVLKAGILYYLYAKCLRQAAGMLPAAE